MESAPWSLESVVHISILRLSIHPRAAKFRRHHSDGKFATVRVDVSRGRINAENWWKKVVVVGLEFRVFA